MCFCQELGYIQRISGTEPTKTYVDELRQLSQIMETFGREIDLWKIKTARQY